MDDSTPPSGSAAPPIPEAIERAFVRIEEGQVHLRRLAAADPSAPPLLLLHASPASSWFMQNLMLTLRSSGVRGEIVAPDTPGNGDSCVPAVDEPDIGYFADAMRRLCDALGLATVDVYGTHTGARIACELAAAFPDRVRRVVLDGITEYPDELREVVIANYAPVVEPDAYGRHLIWAFNFCRDQALFFPHFMQQPQNRLAVPIPPPDILHRITLDVLKSLGSYSKPYIAIMDGIVMGGGVGISAHGSHRIVTENSVVARALEILTDGRAVSLAAGDAAKAAAMAHFLSGGDA